MQKRQYFLLGHSRGTKVFDFYDVLRREKIKDFQKMLSVNSTNFIADKILAS